VDKNWRKNVREFPIDRGFCVGIYLKAHPVYIQDSDRTHQTACHGLDVSDCCRRPRLIKI